MPTSSTVIDDADRGVQLELLIEGAGPDVILIPSALRGASDFTVVQDLLAPMSPGGRPRASRRRTASAA
jgi:hypothetical protein